MRRAKTGRVFAFSTLLLLLAVHPAKAQQDWSWKDSQGNIWTGADLEKILREHRAWVESAGKSGYRAELNGGFDFSDAFLLEVNLRDAQLGGSVWRHAELIGANLTNANLEDANLSDADLKAADLTKAYLKGADLSDADLGVSTLREADLDSAKLRNTILYSADLTHASLVGTDLGGASLLLANLDATVFEPKSLPDLREIATAKNLELLTYDANPDALAQLRKQFEDGGFRDLERKITYALKRRETKLAWDHCVSTKTLETNINGAKIEGKTREILWSSDSSLANCASFVLNRVFFDWTCQYGMSPGRPLSFGALLWLVCSVLYFACIRASKEAGLYRVYAQSIQEDPSSRLRVERISPPAIAQMRGVRRFLHLLWREFIVLRAAMFFSLMSAFNIGFRDINFGRWLRLLTRQEFDIKAVGWARMVAGWQSLISVYLIALWILTYFGRPFG